MNSCAPKITCEELRKQKTYLALVHFPSCLLPSFLLHCPTPPPSRLSEVQCVLLGDLLVLLQRQDDKMVLKCQSKSNIAVQEGKQMLSPIIKLDSVFLREVATGQPHALVSPTNTVSSIVRLVSFNLPIAVFSFFLRSKGLLCDIYLGQRCSDLWTGGPVCWREENVGVREKNTS